MSCAEVWAAESRGHEQWALKSKSGTPPAWLLSGTGQPSGLLRGVSETASSSAPASMQAMAGGVSGKELGYVIQKRDLWARVIALKRREVGVSVRVRPENHGGWSYWKC